MENIIYLGKVVKVPGSSSVPAMADFPVLRRAIDEEGMTFVDVKAIASQNDELRAALAREALSREKSGKVDEPVARQRASEVIVKAVLTIVEHKIMTVSGLDIDADTLRACVQQEVRVLRREAVKSTANTTVKEKDLVPPAMYKWAYSAITSK